MSKKIESVTGTGGMTIVRPSPLVVPRSGEVGLSLLSDVHLGARNCDEGLFLQDLEEAAARRDRLLINGDLWDLILPGDSKRFKPSVLATWLRGRDDVIDAAV